MTMLQEAIHEVELLPEEQLPLLVQFVDFLRYSFEKGSTETEQTKNAKKSLLGILPGKVFLSDNFNEIPDGFEDYV